MATEGKVITCKAAVAWKAREALSIEEIQVEPPQAQEIRVKITHTSLCHTDISFWQTETSNGGVRFPCILGHEASGIIESVGCGVTEFKAGDHVLPLFMAQCMHCKQCRSGKTNLCKILRPTADKSVMPSDGKTRFSQNGSPIFHFVGASTFSEYTVLDHRCAAKVDIRAPLDRICLLSCGVTTGLGAALNTAKVEAKSTVAVFGLGTIGLAVAEGAKMAGALQIIGVDVNPKKSELAVAFGVTNFLNPNDLDRPVEQFIQEMTDGGVDYSFECVGNVEVMHTALLSCHDGGGVCVICGVVTDNMKKLSLHPSEILLSRTLKGSLFGDFRGATDLPKLVERYMNEEIKLDKFVTSELPFSNINKAFEMMLKGEGLTCVLHVAGGHEAEAPAALVDPAPVQIQTENDKLFEMAIKALQKDTTIHSVK